MTRARNNMTRAPTTLRDTLHEEVEYACETQDKGTNLVCQSHINIPGEETTGGKPHRHGDDTEYEGL